ncbi:hypothetical protein L6452_34267 [Arctium lappa]|uniref:Uncharacterized protein n=1 Tax=Arctium lappa TaxID=4217 RepID=A0ACB8YIF7_ARCLA|nr:hypothetical protein L6452_34267 [Arctium lappa]
MNLNLNISRKQHIKELHCSKRGGGGGGGSGRFLYSSRHRRQKQEIEIIEGFRPWWLWLPSGWFIRDIPSTCNAATRQQRKAAAITQWPENELFMVVAASGGGGGVAKCRFDDRQFIVSIAIVSEAFMANVMPARLLLFVLLANCGSCYNNVVENNRLSNNHGLDEWLEF